MRSRGILARDAAGLEQMSQLVVTEEFLVAGRIRLGPAPQNLAIPPYNFVSDTKIKIG